MPRILVVDDRPKALEHLASAAHVVGAEVVTATNAHEAQRRIAVENFDVVVTDLKMETDQAGLDVLKAAKEKDDHTQVIVITAYGTPAISVEVMRLGAFDYLEKNVPGTDVFAMTTSKVAQALDYQTAAACSSGALSMFGPPRQDAWPRVFVVMPFSVNLKRIYEDHIRKVVLKAALDVGRADDFFGTQQVIRDIWSAIHAAHLIIADCTGRNPNVFYEIGIAHTLGKETILISQSLDDIPFDLRHLRTIQYEYTPPGMRAFEKTLIETIKKSTPNRLASPAGTGGR